MTFGKSLKKFLTIYKNLFTIVADFVMHGEQNVERCKKKR